MPELYGVEAAAQTNRKKIQMNNKYELWTMRSKRDNNPLASLDFKIYVPESLQAELIWRYHENLNHPGVSRMIATIGQHFRLPGMTSQIKEHVRKCPECQKAKITAAKKYGIVPKGN